MTAILPLPDLSVRSLALHRFAPQFAVAKDMMQGRQSQPTQGYQAENAQLSVASRDSIVVSAATLAVYAKDLSLGLNLAHFSTPEQAAKYLENLLGRMVVTSDKIKSLVQARQDLMQPVSVDVQDEARVAQMHALQVGHNWRRKRICSGCPHLWRRPLIWTPHFFGKKTAALVSIRQISALQGGSLRNLCLMGGRRCCLMWKSLRDKARVSADLARLCLWLASPQDGSHLRYFCEAWWCWR
jgi:hypothetical protein